VRGYVEHYGLRIADEDIRREALAWALARGAR
jgi:predicted AAA+ superfamily ATPase